MNKLFFFPFKSLFIDKSISIDNLFFSLILIFMPVALLTGPAIPDIFLSLTACYFLVISLKRKLLHYYKNPIVIGFLLFCIYSIFRSFLSEIPFKSLTNEGSVFYFRYIFFSMCVWYLLDKNPYLSRCLLSISILSLIFVVTDGFYQYFFEVSIFGNEKYNVYRLTGLFVDEPIIGRYIAYLSLFAFALIHQNFNQSKKTISISFIFLIICAVLVFLSGERVPFFNIIFFLLLIIIYLPKYKVYRFSSIFFIIVIIYTVLQINPIAKKRMIDMTVNQISKTKIPFLPYSTSHEIIYKETLKMISDKPLFGVGTNTYRFQCKKIEYKIGEGCSSHPHNFYLQVLAETGIVGFAFLSIFFSYLISIGLKQIFFVIKRNKNKIISFDKLLYPMVLLVYWWPIMPHMSLYNNWNNVLMMLPLGFFMRYFYGSSNNGYSNKL